MEKQHNYGIITIENEEKYRREMPYKKVVLVNVADCIDRITVNHVYTCLNGMGGRIWQYLLANWLVSSIEESIKNGKAEADISKMFTADLLVDDEFGHYEKKQMMVVDFLMGRLFECLEEDDDVMKVRIIKKAICKV